MDRFSSGLRVQRKVYLRVVGTKRRIGRIHVVVVRWTSKKCTKRRDARAELVFAHNPNCFFALSLSSSL